LTQRRTQFLPTRNDALSVGNTDPTDASLQHLKRLQRLYCLAGDNTKISDEGFIELAKFLPKLWVPSWRRNGK
jgi:hypothetical protein